LDKLLALVFGGKEKLLSLGTYPDLSLKEAREKRDAAKKLLAQGVDPSAQRQAVKASTKAENENSYEVVAREWYAKHAAGWSESNREKILARQVCFPSWMGKRQANGQRGNYYEGLHLPLDIFLDLNLTLVKLGRFKVTKIVRMQHTNILL